MNYLLKQLQTQERTGLDIAGWHMTIAREETVVLGMRSQLMCDLELLIAKRGWTQARTANELRIAQFRVTDLVRQVGQIQPGRANRGGYRAGRKVTLELV